MKHLNETLVALAIGGCATSANASFFNNATGLDSPDQTITFESVVLVHNQAVTTEFESLGVTFANAFANPDPSPDYPNISGNRIGNFQSNVVQNGLFTLDFSGTLKEVAFAMVTDTGTSTFQVWLDGALVESAMHSTSGADNTNFYGFRDLVFDRLTISTDTWNHALMIDNLQTVAVVPEPTSWTLALAGLALMGGLARRRRQ